MQITDHKNLVIVASIALIDASDQILIAKRPNRKTFIWVTGSFLVEK